MIAPGEKIGRYQLREPLGSGGMSCVYRAYDPTLDREVALKILPPELGRDETLRLRFQEEARSLARVEHPNLVRIYAVGQEGLASFYSMEIVGGRSLRQILASVGKLNLEETGAVVWQVLGALQAVHDSGIVHRDIKPGNIMIDAAGRAILMDFGLARREERQSFTAAGAVLGTPEYMSPEQARGDKADLRSDLYSLGIILYELLGGRPPFRGKDTISILRGHIETAPPPLDEIAPDVPVRLREIIGRLLEKEPFARYPHVRSLVADLTDALPQTNRPDAVLRALLGRAAARSDDVTRTMSGEEAAPASAAASGVGAARGDRLRTWAAVVSAAVAIVALVVVVVALPKSHPAAPAVVTPVSAPGSGYFFTITPRVGEPFDAEFVSVHTSADGRTIWAFRKLDGTSAILPDSDIRRMEKKGGKTP